MKSPSGHSRRGLFCLTGSYPPCFGSCSRHLRLEPPDISFPFWSWLIRPRVTITLGHIVWFGEGTEPKSSSYIEELLFDVWVKKYSLTPCSFINREACSWGNHWHPLCNKKMPVKIGIKEQWRVVKTQGMGYQVLVTFFELPAQFPPTVISTSRRSHMT